MTDKEELISPIVLFVFDTLFSFLCPLFPALLSFDFSYVVKYFKIFHFLLYIFYSYFLSGNQEDRI